jgi:hypothetical protein
MCIHTIRSSTRVEIVISLWPNSESHHAIERWQPQQANSCSTLNRTSVEASVCKKSPVHQILNCILNTEAK